MKSAVLALSFIILSACSSTMALRKDSLRRELVNGERHQVTDEEIKKVFDLKPQLPKPFKIGVYFADNNSRYGDERWNAEDKEMILKLEEELKKSGEVSKMFLINEAVVTGTDLKSIRLAAAHHGADALLMISSAQDVDKYANDLSAFYILLLPMFFVPGTTTEALFITRAALWDVRNEYLYMAVESESFKTKKASVANSDSNRLLLKAKKDSLSGLKKEILRMAAEISKK